MLSTSLGLYVSYWLDASTAGCIVLVQAAVFALALLLAPRHGLLAQRRRGRRTRSMPS
jgi:manganese transport system permease protein